MSQQPDERKASDTVTATNDPYAQTPATQSDQPATPESERETIIVIPGDRSAVSVWTNIPKHIRAFRKKQTTGNQPSKVRTRRQGFYGSTEWAEFEIDEADFNPAQAVKRNSNLSPEQRRQAAERLANIRKAAK